MRKLLDVSTVLKEFNGDPIKNGDKDFLLKDAILQYINLAHLMGLTKIEESILYAVGMLVGRAGGEVGLAPEQYDALKKMIDDGSIPEGGERKRIYNIPIHQQVKQLVDAARTEEAAA